MSSENEYTVYDGINSELVRTDGPVGWVYFADLEKSEETKSEDSDDFICFESNDPGSEKNTKVRIFSFLLEFDFNLTGVTLLMYTCCEFRFFNYIFFVLFPTRWSSVYLRKCVWFEHGDTIIEENAMIFGNKLVAIMHGSTVKSQK